MKKQHILLLLTIIILPLGLIWSCIKYYQYQQTKQHNNTLEHNLIQKAQQSINLPQQSFIGSWYQDTKAAGDLICFGLNYYNHDQIQTFKFWANHSGQIVRTDF